MAYDYIKLYILISRVNIVLCVWRSVTNHITIRICQNKKYSPILEITFDDYYIVSILYNGDVVWGVVYIIYARLSGNDKNFNANVNQK